MLTLPYQIPAQEGGVHFEQRHLFFTRCCGWCSLSLHHQMVRRRSQGRQIA
jgi:hypothetical protein